MEKLVDQKSAGLQEDQNKAKLVNCSRRSVGVGSFGDSAHPAKV